MDVNSISSKIPDFHFDWYARLLPGSFGVVVYIVLSGYEYKTGLSDLFLYACIGYVLGHVVQPLAGFLTKRIEQGIHSEKGENEKYKKLKKDPDNFTLVSKVSKAHAEANSMMSCAILLLVVIFYLKKVSLLPAFLILYFVVMSVERAFARKRKIEDTIKANA